MLRLNFVTRRVGETTEALAQMAKCQSSARTISTKITFSRSGAATR